MKKIDDNFCGYIKVDDDTYTYNVFIFNFKTNIMKKTKAFTMLEILVISLLLGI